MNIRHYSYTRGRRMDYGTFLKADNLPAALESRLKEQVRSIRREAAQEHALATPFWILVKEEGVIVWGVCCINSLLSPTKNTDHQGRDVYGFFAVVVSDYTGEQVRLPYDLGYFKEFYAREIAPLWEQEDPHFCSTNDFLEGNFERVGPFSNSYLSSLNTDPKLCRSLGSVDRAHVLSAALTLERVSLLIDNVVMAQATLPEAPFMNCLSAVLPERDQTIRQPAPPKPRRSPQSVTAMQSCPQCGAQVQKLEPEGYCATCKNEIEENRKEEEKMIKKLEKELQCASHRIQELERKNFDLKVELNRKQKSVKYLSYLAIALLVGLLSTCDFNFEKKNIWGSLWPTEEPTPEADPEESEVTPPTMGSIAQGESTADGAGTSDTTTTGGTEEGDQSNPQGSSVGDEQ